MIARWIENTIREEIENFRCIYLTGARQTGKTTLCENLNLEGARHVSLDNKLAYNTALLDPESFVERHEARTLIIDEVQKAPDLLDYIKFNIDHDNAKGQYLLTGSSNFLQSRKIRDSLVGRVCLIRLRTLSLGEILGKKPTFLRRAFERDWNGKIDRLTKADIVNLAFKGGYPEARELTERSRKRWYSNYLEGLLEKDLQDLSDIRMLSKLREVALWLLACSAQFFTIEEITAKCAISRKTAENYLMALKALYLFDSVPPWCKSDYDRMGKRPKWLASDPGLVTNLLGWKQDIATLDGRLSGKLVENWVYHELAAQADAAGLYEITHYRDSSQREIDFLVENEKGDLLGIEVKAGLAAPDDFKHLRWFKDNLAKERNFTGIVLNTAREAMSFGDGMYAVPLGAFGEE